MRIDPHSTLFEQQREAALITAIHDDNYVDNSLLDLSPEAFCQENAEILFFSLRQNGLSRSQIRMITIKPQKPATPRHGALHGLQILHQVDGSLDAAVAERGAPRRHRLRTLSGGALPDTSVDSTSRSVEHHKSDLVRRHDEPRRCRKPHQPGTDRHRTYLWKSIHGLRHAPVGHSQGHDERPGEFVELGQRVESIGSEPHEPGWQSDIPRYLAIATGRRRVSGLTPGPRLPTARYPHRFPRPFTPSSIRVHATPGLATEVPGGDHLLEQRARTILRVREFFVVDVHHG